jgi:hypothetical protein
MILFDGVNLASDTSFSELHEVARERPQARVVPGPPATPAL